MDNPALEKTVITFPITISKSNNSIKTDDSCLDQRDKFGCSILGINWPEKKGEPLWRIQKFLYKIEGAPKDYAATCMGIRYFDSEKTNPLFTDDLKEAFAFPRALPDPFVQELVKTGTIIKEFENTTARFVLQNTSESLEELGLKAPEKTTGWLNVIPKVYKKDTLAPENKKPDTVILEDIKRSNKEVKKSNNIFLVGGAFVGIAGLVAWFLATDDTNPYKAQILNFLHGLMSAKQ